MLNKIDVHLKSIISLLYIQITKIQYFSRDHSHNKKGYFYVYVFITFLYGDLTHPTSTETIQTTDLMHNLHRDL